MENTAGSDLQSWEEFEDDLSFCNLSVDHEQEHHQADATLDREIRNSQDSDQDYHFEFSTTTSNTSNFPTNPTLDDSIMFCGKIITPPRQQPSDCNLIYDQKHALFPAAASPNHKTRHQRSNSFHLRQSPKPGASPSLPSGTRSFRHVSSSKSLSRNNDHHHRKVLIGLARIPARMDLDDMKKRQSRLAPVPMFPGEAIDGSVGRKSRRRMFQGPLGLRCGGYLVSALARASSGCIPIVRSHV